ncbi:MAG: hypothetical protein FJ109_06470 [Deltaproteobacteria bacterium]|nr:hypothetical protein [Deltaproteobacteria bacterium]
MSIVVDARGLSCPGPVMETVAAMARAGAGDTLEVLVDSATARDNVARTARTRGWNADIEARSGDFVVKVWKP